MKDPKPKDEDWPVGAHAPYQFQYQYYTSLHSYEAQECITALELHLSHFN
jgi:hypothetical protein